MATKENEITFKPRNTDEEGKRREQNEIIAKKEEEKF